MIRQIFLFFPIQLYTKRKPIWPPRLSWRRVSGCQSDVYRVVQTLYSEEWNWFVHQVHHLVCLNMWNLSYQNHLNLLLIVFLLTPRHAAISLIEQHSSALKNCNCSFIKIYLGRPPVLLFLVNLISITTNSIVSRYCTSYNVMCSQQPIGYTLRKGPKSQCIPQQGTEENSYWRQKRNTKTVTFFSYKVIKFNCMYRALNASLRKLF